MLLLKALESLSLGLVSHFCSVTFCYFTHFFLGLSAKAFRPSFFAIFFSNSKAERYLSKRTSSSTNNDFLFLHSHIITVLAASAAGASSTRTREDDDEGQRSSVVVQR